MLSFWHNHICILMFHIKQAPMAMVRVSGVRKDYWYTWLVKVIADYNQNHTCSPLHCYIAAPRIFVQHFCSILNKRVLETCYISNYLGYLKGPFLKIYNYCARMCETQIWFAKTITVKDRVKRIKIWDLKVNKSEITNIFENSKFYCFFNPVLTIV